MCGCNCITCKLSKNDILKCLFIYNKYKWLLDSYVLDYYVKGQWSYLPSSWKIFFEKLSPSEISALLDPSKSLTSISKVCPLEIACLRKLFQFLNMPRSAINIEKLYKKPIKHTVYKNIIENNTSKLEPNNEDCLLNHPRLKNSFWKRMSPKKKHEITVMAQICSTVARHSDCKIVLDFGSGLGHLSRILAYGYGLTICGLEAQSALSKEAHKLDLQFEVTASKHLTENQMKQLQRPVHVNMKLENHNVNELVELVKKAVNGNDDIKFGVVGLHPCGDLAAILLRFFKESPNVKFINVASCCYMKLSTKDEQINYFGYPLSTFVKSIQKHDLSYISRELACHAIETYMERLKIGDYIYLKTHAYRALLEKIIVKYWPEKSHTGLRNVKCNKEMTFYEYSTKALDGLDFTIPDEELKSDEIKKGLENWKNVVIYYSLRLMFAPMIETIVLLDRLLYIASSETECSLVPVFDSKLSPRSHILIATKNNNS